MQMILEILKNIMKFNKIRALKIVQLIVKIKIIKT